MAEDVLPILTRFHREILLPDIKRLIEESEQRVGARFDEVNGHFDKVYHRLDRLDGLQAQVQAIEARLDD